MDKISCELLDTEIQKVTPIVGGYRCHICGREIRLKRLIFFGNDARGVGFMRISMGQHIKAHIRSRIEKARISVVSSKEETRKRIYNPTTKHYYPVSPHTHSKGTSQIIGLWHKKDKPSMASSKEETEK